MTALLQTSILTREPLDVVTPVATDSAATESLLLRFFAMPDGHAGRDRLRDQIIEANLPLAYRLARRYAGRGEPIEDLRQVAAMALVKLVDRYDPTRQVLFVSYAIPTILGEIKRYFRDNSRMIRIPRSSQELSRAVTTATDDLSHQLARTVTIADLAIHLRVPAYDVAQAASATRASHPASLDTAAPGAIGALDSVVGVADPRYGQVDDRLLVHQLVAPLSTREQRILDLRFRSNLTQAQISVTIGVSQMQVSRLLTKSLRTMRLAALQPA